MNLPRTSARGPHRAHDLGDPDHNLDGHQDPETSPPRAVPREARYVVTFSRPGGASPATGTTTVESVSLHVRDVRTRRQSTPRSTVRPVGAQRDTTRTAAREVPVRLFPDRTRCRSDASAAPTVGDQVGDGHVDRRRDGRQATDPRASTGRDVASMRGTSGDKTVTLSYSTGRRTRPRSSPRSDGAESPARRPAYPPVHGRDAVRAMSASARTR
jgi:hypothetical protein